MYGNSLDKHCSDYRTQNGTVINYDMTSMLSLGISPLSKNPLLGLEASHRGKFSKKQTSQHTGGQG